MSEATVSATEATIIDCLSLRERLRSVRAGCRRARREHRRLLGERRASPH